MPLFWDLRQKWWCCAVCASNIYNSKLNSTYCFEIIRNSLFSASPPLSISAFASWLGSSRHNPQPPFLLFSRINPIWGTTTPLSAIPDAARVFFVAGAYRKYPITNNKYPIAQRTCLLPVKALTWKMEMRHSFTSLQMIFWLAGHRYWSDKYFPYYVRCRNKMRTAHMEKTRGLLS